jgi:4-hydroxybenzoate polyprenyltransferase
MTTAYQQPAQTVLSHVKLFLALSRTPHGLIDMASCALAALFCLGAIPPTHIVIMGIITAFAGYTSVYALNDLVDHRIDKKKIIEGLAPDLATDIDSIFVRHPIAHGLLTFRQGLLWTVAWGIVALIGACLLNPYCVFVFLGSCILEAVYCLLWRGGYLKVLISGAVKTAGAIAAVFAVDQQPSPVFVVLLFLWFYFWEIGGQNVPNDFLDIREDRILKATTIPVHFGPSLTKGIIIVSLIITMLLNIILWNFSPMPGPRLIPVAAAFCTGLYLLILPARRLYRTEGQGEAMALFNKASYYPLTMLIIAGVDVVVYANL